MTSPLRIEKNLSKTERNSQILKMWNNGNGITVDEICRQFGIGKTTAYEIIQPRKTGNSANMENTQRPEMTKSKPENTQKLERQISELEAELERVKSDVDYWKSENSSLEYAYHEAEKNRKISEEKAEKLENRISELEAELLRAQRLQAEDLRKNLQNSESWEAEKQSIERRFSQQLADAKKVAQEEINANHAALEQERQRLESEFRSKLESELKRNSELLENAGKRHAETSELFREFRLNSELEIQKLQSENSEMKAELEILRAAEKKRNSAKWDAGKFLTTNRNMRFLFVTVMVLGQAFVLTSLEQRLFGNAGGMIPFGFAYLIAVVLEFAGIVKSAERLQPGKFQYEMEEKAEKRNFWLGAFFLLQVLVHIAFWELIGSEYSAVLGKWLIAIIIPFGIFMYGSLYFNTENGK